VIAAIGTNDFLNAYKEGHTPAQVINITVPLALKAVRKDLEVSSYTTNLYIVTHNKAPLIIIKGSKIAT